MCTLVPMRARWRRGRGMRCPVRARYAYGEGVEGATGGVRPSEGHNPYMRHSPRFANRRCNTECCFVAQVVRAYQNGEAGTVGHACEVGEAGVALAASPRDFRARIRVPCVHQIGRTRLRRTAGADRPESTPESTPDRPIDVSAGEGPCSASCVAGDTCLHQGKYAGGQGGDAASTRYSRPFPQVSA